MCRLASDARIPAWALEGRFFCVMRTREELSIVCSEDVCTEDACLEDVCRTALSPSADGWR